MDWNNLYFNYSGRVNRQPYWWGSLALGLVQLVLLFLIAVTLGTGFDTTSFNVLEGLLSLFFLYPALAVTTKSGFIFLFDRANGKSLNEIVEKPDFD